MIIILPIEIAKLNDVSRNKSTMTDSNHIYLRLSIECIVLSNSITCFYSLVLDICHDFILKALNMLTLQARFQHTNKIDVSFSVHLDLMPPKTIVGISPGLFPTLFRMRID